MPNISITNLIWWLWAMPCPKQIRKFRPWKPWDFRIAPCPRPSTQFAAKGKQQIVVTGTHGKTTTSSFIAWMLHCAGLDPSFLIGGIVSNFNSNYRAGKGSWIVLEGDEYDTAFFDKGPKFWHYSPSVAVLTSVEFDHADIFNDLEQIISVFGRNVGTVVQPGSPGGL